MIGKEAGGQWDLQRSRSLLTVVPFLVNLSAFGILFLIQLMPFAPGDMPIVCRSVRALLIADALILGMELGRFARVQLAVAQAGVDATILMAEAVVYLRAPRVVVLPFAGMSGAREHKAAQ